MSHPDHSPWALCPDHIMNLPSGLQCTVDREGCVICDEIRKAKTRTGGPLSIKKLADDIHTDAKSNGWWESPRSPLEIYALVHSELSEAVEEARTNNPVFYKDEKGKPCGESTEVADAIIRLLDYCAYREWNIDEIIRVKRAFNLTRGHRHGGKKY